MAARHVVVDGSNLATEGRQMPSLAQLDRAVREFLLENPDDVVTVVVDASFGHRIDNSEFKLFEEAEAAGVRQVIDKGLAGHELVLAVETMLNGEGRTAAASA